MDELFECCADLFYDFIFEDLTSGKPLNQKSVYTIRINKRSEVPLDIVIGKTRQFLSGIKWDLVTDFVMSRVERLCRVGNCPI